VKNFNSRADNPYQSKLGLAKRQTQRLKRSPKRVKSWSQSNAWSGTCQRHATTLLSATKKPITLGPTRGYARNRVGWEHSSHARYSFIMLM